MKQTTLIDDLPDWVPVDDWNGFVAMRRLIKKPLTDGAKKRAIRDLAALREVGQDPSKVLNQSEDNCWAGLFAVKVEHVRMVANGRPQLTLVDQQRQNSAEASRLIGGDDWRTIDEAR